MNALTGRGPPILRALLAELPQSFVSAPTVAELSWASGRLDPEHLQTGKVVAVTVQVLDSLDPAKVMVPTSAQWRLAGERAGTAVRALAGPQRSFRSAAERQEMLNDALTAVVVLRARRMVMRVARPPNCPCRPTAIRTTRAGLGRHVRARQGR